VKPRPHATTLSTVRPRESWRLVLSSRAWAFRLNVQGRGFIAGGIWLEPCSWYVGPLSEGPPPIRGAIRASRWLRFRAWLRRLLRPGR
jgi:hypothetical protein